MGSNRDFATAVPQSVANTPPAGITLTTRSFPRPSARERRRRFAGFISAATLLVGVLLILYQESLQIAPVVLTLVALGVLIGCLGWSHRRYCLLITMDLLLIFAYTWSLGETMHVVIHVTPRGYTADIGGNTRWVSFPLPETARHPARALSRRPAPRVGLYAGTNDEYIVDPIGGPGFLSSTAHFKTIAGWLRFATPSAAWTNVHITYPSPSGQKRVNVSKLTSTSGNWSPNVRGELAGTPGAIGLVPGKLPRSFTLSADLMRSDGIQGVLIGTHLPKQGHMLVIAMDRREAWWTPWLGTGPGHWAEAPQPQPQFPIDDGVMAIQYVLRNFLPSLIVALLLLALVIPVFALARLVTRRLIPALASLDMTKPRDIFRKINPGHAADGAALSMAILGAVVIGWLATYAYQRIPSTQDTAGDIFEAKTFALGRLWSPVPKHVSFFSQYSVLDYLHHWFAKYPPGWPLVLSVGVILGAAWMVNPVVSGISLLLVYLIGRELYGRKVGLLAELLALTSPFLLFIGAGFYAEPVTWMFMGLYVYMLLLWKRHVPTRSRKIDFAARTAGYLVLSGLAIGMATMSRPLDAAAFGFPFLILLVRRPLAVVWLALGTIVPLALYVTYSALVYGSFIPNGHELADKWDRVGFGPGVGGLPHTYFAGFSPQISLMNLASAIENFHLSVFGWPFFIALAIIAVPFVLGRSQSGDWLIAAAALSILTAYMFYWGTAIIQSSFPRYWYPVIPCAALLAARGFQEIYRLPLHRALRLPYDRVAAMVAPAGLLALLLCFNFTAYTPSLAAAIHFWNRDNAAPLNAALDAHVHNAIVFQVQNVGHWWPYGCVFSQNSPLLNGNIVWAKDEGANDWVVMREYPHRSYYRLNNTTLTRITPATSGQKPAPIPTGQGTQECGAVYFKPIQGVYISGLSGSPPAFRRAVKHLAASCHLQTAICHAVAIAEARIWSAGRTISSRPKSPLSLPLVPKISGHQGMSLLGPGIHAYPSPSKAGNLASSVQSVTGCPSAVRTRPWRSRLDSA